MELGVSVMDRSIVGEPRFIIMIREKSDILWGPEYTSYLVIANCLMCLVVVVKKDCLMTSMAPRNPAQPSSAHLYPFEDVP